MKRRTLATVSSLFVCGSLMGQPLYDQDVTPDVIFGSGNANGSFTVDRSNSIEVGLRGKLRFDETNSPQNTFNSNGDGSYTFRTGTPPTGFGFAPNAPTTPVWNFEWSVNTDFDDLSGAKLSDYTYRLFMDADPTSGTNFLEFDPINLPLADHALGDNSTGNGGGSVATNAADYATLLGDSNVAQNSWSYEFFNDVGTPLENFDPNVKGSYIIGLGVYDDLGAELAYSEIEITPVPEPSLIAFLGLGGLGGFLFLRRRYRAKK